jgi:hypothetical protein
VLQKPFPLERLLSAVDSALAGMPTPVLRS